MKNTAFTIIELIVTMAIVILLTGLVLQIAGYVQRKARLSQIDVEMNAITAALENYKTDNGVYPSNDDSRTLSPASTNPAQYQPSSSLLYSQLTGDDDANPITLSPPDAKNYFGITLKPSMLAPNPPGPNTFLRDAFGNSYGYSTAKADNPNGFVGNNPTFDLWSTANSTNQSQWIRNW